MELCDIVRQAQGGHAIANMARAFNLTPEQAAVKAWSVQHNPEHTWQCARFLNKRRRNGLDLSRRYPALWLEHFAGDLWRHLGPSLKDLYHRRQGRDSKSQLWLVPLKLHFILLLADKCGLPHWSPYSNAVNSDQLRIAAPSAALRLGRPALAPEWV